MRCIRALVGLLLLAVPLLISSPPAGAEIIFTGACTMNATATFSAGRIDIAGAGTCHVGTFTVPGDFTSAVFGTGVSPTCNLGVSNGLSTFNLRGSVGAVASPITEVVNAAGTMTIGFVEGTRVLGVGVFAVASAADALACATGGSTIHYTGAVVLEDPTLPA